jgi:hypothetical protein
MNVHVRQPVAKRIDVISHPIHAIFNEGMSDVQVKFQVGDGFHHM